MHLPDGSEDPLSPKQRAVYDLRHESDPQLTWMQIAAKMDMGHTSVRDLYRRAEGRLENTNTKTYLPTADAKVSPEQVSRVVDDVMGPDKTTITALAERSGMGRTAAAKIAKDIDTKYVDAFRDVKEITTEAFLRAFEHLGMRALSGITDAQMDKMNPYQRAVIAAICMDKRELLAGRPTERISVEDRRQLPELIGIVLKEAQRRGLEVGKNPQTLEATLTIDQDAPPGVRSGREKWTPKEEVL